MKTTTVICFDFWGTLVEGGGQPQIVETSLLTHPWPLKKGVAHLAHKLKLKTDKETVQKACQSWSRYAEKAGPYPESEETLSQLHKKNIIEMYHCRGLNYSN